MKCFTPRTNHPPVPYSSSPPVARARRTVVESRRHTGSLQRLMEEFQRASELCSGGASLAASRQRGSCWTRTGDAGRRRKGSALVTSVGGLGGWIPPATPTGSPPDSFWSRCSSVLPGGGERAEISARWSQGALGTLGAT